MKKIVFTLSILIALAMINPTISNAQFRSEMETPPISERIGIPYSPSNSSLVLGFLDPAKLDMQQSYSISFSSSGGGYGSLGLYRNRISYTISPKMQVIADLGYLHRPFSSLGSDAPGAISPGLRNGTLLYGGELRYRPTDNTYINIRIGNMPRAYSGYHNGYYNGYYHRNPYRGYRSPFQEY